MGDLGHRRQRAGAHSLSHAAARLLRPPEQTLAQWTMSSAEAGTPERSPPLQVRVPRALTSHGPKVGDGRRTLT